MADQLPCPNPTCSHVFTMVELQLAATVACPRCGFRIKGSGPAVAPAPSRPAPSRPAPSRPAPPSKSVPMAQFAAPQGQMPAAAPKQPRAPLATPVRPAPPAAGAIDVDLVPSVPQRAPLAAPIVPATTVTPSTAARPRPTAVDETLPQRRDGLRALMRVLVMLFAFGAALGVVAGGVGFIVFGLGVHPFTIRKDGGGFLSADYSQVTGNARNLKGNDEKAFVLRLQRNAWDNDRELKQHFGALGAWVNKSDELWLAIAVKDYGTQRPRDAELLQMAIEKLEGHFGESLELAAKAEPTEFAGAKGQKLTFKGQLGAVVNWGECVTFVHHGFAYWVFLAGPTLDDIKSYAGELRKEETGFALVTERMGWREQPPRTEMFSSADGAVSITAIEGVWEKSVPPNVEFATGSLLLWGKYLKERDNTKNAHLQVFTIAKQADLKEAMAEAKDFLEKHKKEQLTGYKLGAADEKLSDLGVVEDVGNRRGQVAELMLSLNNQPTRYYVLAVVSEADHVNVILCDCLWRSRQIWRQDFLDLLKTYKAKANP